VNEFEKMAQRLNDAIMNPENAEPILKQINSYLYDLARKESGVRADQLSDESQEDTPIVRLFWTTLSLVQAKLYMLAANGLHVIPSEEYDNVEWDQGSEAGSDGNKSADSSGS